MDVLHYTSRFFCRRPSAAAPLRRRFVAVRSSSLPFPTEKAKYHRELQAAVDVVERACRLCVDVKKTLFSSEGRILEKIDQTPVTVADFGVQALVSLELGKSFPSIPLVAEEDSAFLRANNLVDSVVSAVTDKAYSGDKSLSDDVVLEAIDRGGPNYCSFGAKPATYWVLDPIDGTKGFLRGAEALYVVGLALVVDGEIVLGVMGCPNWKNDKSLNSTAAVLEDKDPIANLGIIMVSHVGCGTWTKTLSNLLGTSAKTPESWTRCSVDRHFPAQEAYYCIPDSQTWESIPLSAVYKATADADSGDKEILLLPIFCGSLCKYLAVATGGVSVFIQHARAEKTIKAWDHAVGVICVHEAGGKVTDWRGRELDFSADQAGRRIIYPSGGVLVTNGNVHDSIIDMIASTPSIV